MSLEAPLQMVNHFGREQHGNMEGVEIAANRKPGSGSQRACRSYFIEN